MRICIFSILNSFLDPKYHQNRLDPTNVDKEYHEDLSILHFFNSFFFFNLRKTTFKHIKYHLYKKRYSENPRISYILNSIF